MLGTCKDDEDARFESSRRSSTNSIQCVGLDGSRDVAEFYSDLNVRETLDVISSSRRGR